MNYEIIRTAYDGYLVADSEGCTLFDFNLTKMWNKSLDEFTEVKRILGASSKEVQAKSKCEAVRLLANSEERFNPRHFCK